MVAPPANSDSKFEESEHVHYRVTIEFRLSALGKLWRRLVNRCLQLLCSRIGQLSGNNGTINAACRSKFQ